MVTSEFSKRSDDTSMTIERTSNHANFYRSLGRPFKNVFYSTDCGVDNCFLGPKILVSFILGNKGPYVNKYLISSKNSSPAENKCYICSIKNYIFNPNILDN